MPPVLKVYDALIFMTEYTLITVAHLRTKKSATRYETSRQVGIAQIGINSIMDEKVGLEAIKPQRIIEVINQYNGRVEDWAEQYKPQGE